MIRTLPIVGLAVALVGCVTQETAPLVQPSIYDRLDEGARLDAPTAQSMINAYRARGGLPELMLDKELIGDAEQRAKAVAGSDRSTWGETPKPGNAATRAAMGGSDPGVLREERVSAGYRTLAEAFSGWRDSPQLNAMMLSPQARRIGIAAVHAPDSKYKVYWAIVLAAP